MTNRTYLESICLLLYSGRKNAVNNIDFHIKNDYFAKETWQNVGSPEVYT